MKNAINYYYGIESYDIHQSKKNYFFTVKNLRYILYECNLNINELKEIYELYTLLNYNNIPCHQFILNKQNSMITTINDRNYILLKINCNIKEIKSEDIIKTNVKIGDNKNNKHKEWHNLWTSKIDYLEYQFLEHKEMLKKMNTSFNYYIGMAETAIMLSKKIKNGTRSICHKRVDSKDTTLELYNPINIIVDYKVRDVCEFYKNKFFYDRLDFYEVTNYINTLNTSDIYIFFVRLFFPSYFFDIFERTIEMKEIDKNYEKIIKRIDEYEFFLKSIYTYIKQIINIEEVEWLTKNVG